MFLSPHGGGVVAGTQISVVNCSSRYSMVALGKLDGLGTENSGSDSSGEVHSSDYIRINYKYLFD